MIITIIIITIIVIKIIKIIKMIIVITTKFDDRRGCPVTALEYCKLLLKMDPSDPLRILVVIDVYCLRANEYNYLLELFFNSNLLRLSSLSDYETAAAASSRGEAGTKKRKGKKKNKSQDSTDTTTTTTTSSSSASSALELDLLPNFLYSCALAKFKLEEKGVDAKVHSHSIFGVFSTPFQRKIWILNLFRNMICQVVKQ